MNKIKNKNSLTALAGAAMALPAISQLATAGTMPMQTEVGYRYSQYTEDDLNEDNVIIGSVERYEIDTHQFRLVKPLSDNKSITLDAMYETLTGASPLSVINNADSEPALVMTGASITETRTDIAGTLESFSDSGSIRYQLGVSVEDDYQAINASFEKDVITKDRGTTYSYGVGFSLDELEPVQGANVNPPESEDKWYASGFVSITKVLSAQWQTQFGFTLGLYDGYLSDPYKAFDERPDERQLYVISARSRYFLRSVKAALHVDYRYYWDDWGMESHTLDLAWYQNFGDSLQVVPRIRYYSQSQADFYYSTDDPFREGYQSSDFQLAPFGALSYGLGIIMKGEKLTFSAHLESYESKGSLAIKEVKQENPALVSYGLFTLGVDYRY